MAGDHSHRAGEFVKHFTQAIHGLLISCPRQDVLRYFAHFRPLHQEFLYKVYALTVTQIHENATAEFRSICEETKVLDSLDPTKNRECHGATDDSDFVSPEEVVREVTLKRKLEEVVILRQALQQAKHNNAQLAVQLEELRAKVMDAKDLRSVDAVIAKTRSITVLGDII